MTLGLTAGMRVCLRCNDDIAASAASPAASSSGAVIRTEIAKSRKVFFLILPQNETDLGYVDMKIGEVAIVLYDGDEELPVNPDEAGYLYVKVVDEFYETDQVRQGWIAHRLGNIEVVPAAEM